jgi:hypothetical protein
MDPVPTRFSEFKTDKCKNHRSWAKPRLPICRCGHQVLGPPKATPAPTGKATVTRPWSLPRDKSSRPLLTPSTEDLPRANSLPAPAKLPFSDSVALNPIQEEAQASSTGREEECPNPSDERASSLPTPAKLPFSDSGALNPIPEEAQAPSMGREEECPNPSDERANSLPTPAKLPLSDSGALNPIPEEAQASPTGREEECLNPSDGP